MAAVTKTLRRLALRARISWMRSRHTQLLVAATQLAQDPRDCPPLRLASTMARAAALGCDIASLEQRA